MSNNLKRVGEAAIVACLLIGTTAQAAIVTYADNRAGFLTATGATSIGSLPGSGGTGVVVGGVKFTNGPGASLVFGDFSNEIAGNDLGVSGFENVNLDIAIAGGTYSFGFDLHEPSYVGTSNPVNGCNAPCFDTTFSIEIFSGATSLGTFNYNAPDDGSALIGGPLGFFGIHSSTAFDRIEVRDGTNTNDNEFFGNFVAGSTPVPLPAAAWLLLSGLAGLGFVGRRRAAA